MDSQNNSVTEASEGAGMPAADKPATSAAEAHQKIEAEQQPPAQAAEPKQPAAPANKNKNKDPAAPAKNARDFSPPASQPAAPGRLEELEQKLAMLMEQNLQLQQMNHDLADAVNRKTRPAPGPTNAAAFHSATEKRHAAPQATTVVQVDPATAQGVRHEFKSEQSFMHMVFMAEEATCYKNVSFEPLRPKFEPMIHKHVTRNVDSKGRRQTETQSQCGHWHPVVFSVDQATGKPVAKCLPPIHEVHRVSESGRIIKSVEPIVFRKELPNGTIENIVDDHTHEMQYRFSEVISQSIIREKQKADREEATRQGIGFSSESVISTAPRPLSPEDGYSLVPGQ